MAEFDTGEKTQVISFRRDDTWRWIDQTRGKDPKRQQRMRFIDARDGS